ncbi:hypothetical protein ACFQU7_19240 [Pseudoroseomonas wenyumeiae]
MMGALGTVLRGVEMGQARLEDIARPLSALSETFTRVVEGRPTFFSWQSLFSDEPAGTRMLRRFILTRPELDYSSLQPGTRATDAIRAAARSWGWTRRMASRCA